MNRPARSVVPSAGPTPPSPARSIVAVAVDAIARTRPSGLPGCRAKRPRATKLELCSELREVVIERLERDHSPRQISGWLRLSYPDNDQMQVSHETIYRALYIPARGSLRRELTRHLQTRRQKRFARAHSNRGQGPGCIAEMVMISERPPEVVDRAVPGHWEGDLLMGTRDTAIATLVERQTRYCRLRRAARGNQRRAGLRSAQGERRCTLPVQLRRSLTWDQGKEMAAHRRFSIETGVEVYFCDPRSPWQRGSNENANGSFASTSRKARASPA